MKRSTAFESTSRPILRNNYDITNITMMMKIDKAGKLNLLWTPYIKATKLDYPKSQLRRKKHHYSSSMPRAMSQQSIRTKKQNECEMLYKNSKVCFLALNKNVEKFVPISQFKPIEVHK